MELAVFFLLSTTFERSLLGNVKQVSSSTPSPSVAPYGPPRVVHTGAGEGGRSRRRRRGTTRVPSLRAGA